MQLIERLSDRCSTASGLRWLALLAALSFLVSVFSMTYAGEEAVYTIISYEMWTSGQWFSPTQYGSYYQRPPLYNWLILLGSQWAGWSHALEVARLISVAASIGSGVMLALFDYHQTRDARRSTFLLAAFLLLGEITFNYGWLAYSDALFSFFALGAMLGAWHGVVRRNAGFLLFGLCMAFGGFLTKALTSYVFFAGAFVAAFWSARAWPLLLRPKVWLALLVPLLLPLLWFRLAPIGQMQAGGMGRDIWEKLSAGLTADYAVQLLTLPLVFLLRALPLTAVLALDARRQGWRLRVAGLQNGLLPLWIVLLNFLPYWFAPQSGTRYLVPLYGILLVFMVDWLWQDQGLAQRGVKVLLAMLAVKMLLAAVVIPVVKDKTRPDVDAIAGEIRQLAGASPLYAENVNWVALSVVARLDMQYGLRAPIFFLPPAGLPENGYVIAREPEARFGTLCRRFVGDVYLMAGRAAACPPVPPAQLSERRLVFAQSQ